jgi:CspA family cold shock protein
MDGTVKSFDVLKNFGFIAPADETRDVFVHRNDLVNATSLRRGDRVEFDVGRDERGRTRAVKVRWVGPDLPGATA